MPWLGPEPEMVTNQELEEACQRLAAAKLVHGEPARKHLRRTDQGVLAFIDWHGWQQCDNVDVEQMKWQFLSQKNRQ